MVFVTLSSSWNIITACVSYSARDCRCLSERTSTRLPRSFFTTTQFGKLESEIFALRDRKDAEGVINACAWGLRDSQGSLLNQSWQILTTSPEVQTQTWQTS